MNNEPVAWLVKNRDSGIGYVQTDEPTRMDKVANEYLPLYTHPVKELTDEEIRKIADEVFSTYKNWHHYQIDFARAILRKAQEK
jgi:hypothetical protein